jgi:mannose/fructose/N-acetylgalactosamine-specific phosphotransferase system component IID
VKLTKGKTAEILWRSFLIQGAWNFRGMQNIGFVYSMLPGLKALAGDGTEKAAGRHLRFFNTHPYMAPTIMGVVLNLEEQGDTATAGNLKQTISSSLAAIGDTFFWGTLKPIMALLFLLTVLMDQVWGIALVLVGYNAIHVWTMTWGFVHGYRRGPEAVIEMGRILSVNRTRKISYAIPLLAGMVLVALPWGKGLVGGLPVLVGIFAASMALYRLKIGVFWLFYGVFTLTLIWIIIQ